MGPFTELAKLLQLPEDLVAALYAAIVFPGLIAMGLFLILGIWLERKLTARIQWRYGPLFVSRKLGGVLQPIADLVKLIFSELVIPRETSKLLFIGIPVASFTLAALPLAFIPAAPGVAVVQSGVAVLIILALILVTSLMLAVLGWVEHNKFAYIGAVREVLLSAGYEVPLIITVMSMVALYSTADPVAIVEAQRTLPGAVMNPIAFIAFVIVMAMATTRFPFEIPEADTEVVFGPYTEYGSGALLIAIAAPYIELYVYSLLATILFLGGWLPIEPTDLVGVVLASLVMFIKAMALSAVLLAFRGIFPRYRIDQALRLGWGKVLGLSLAGLAISLIYTIWF